MTHERFTPYFSSKSEPVAPADVLRGTLFSRKTDAQELISVLLYNLRSTGASGKFLELPIAINGMDQSRLFDMKLITGEKKRFLDSFEDAKLTPLGEFVVSHAVFVEPQTDPILRLIDTKQLDESLADSFSS